MSIIKMLERDIYQPDHCVNYFPNTSFEEFCSYMEGPYAFRRMFMDSKEHTETTIVRNSILMGTILVSLIPILTHKKIYWLRNYHSRKSRILFGLGFFFIPSNIVGAYFNIMTQRELMAKYQINRDQFTRMLEAGDINVTNPYQEWVEY